MAILVIEKANIEFIEKGEFKRNTQLYWVFRFRLCPGVAQVILKDNPMFRYRI